MTGFTPGSAVRPSPKVLGEMSSQNSGFMARGFGADSENSKNLGGFVAVPPGALDSHDTSSPLIPGMEVIDLPPDVINSNKLA